jgi:transcriptional regulator with XRE-family HTH domain
LLDSSFTREYKQIGAKIVYYRRLKGYTQETLAFKAGISTSYLSRIERGTYATGISLSTFMKIAKALDVDVSKLFEMDF